MVAKSAGAFGVQRAQPGVCLVSDANRYPGQHTAPTPVPLPP
jgi:hypothetical protein